MPSFLSISTRQRAFGGVRPEEVGHPRVQVWLGLCARAGGTPGTPGARAVQQHHEAVGDSDPGSRRPGYLDIGRGCLALGDCLERGAGPDRVALGDVVDRFGEHQVGHGVQRVFEGIELPFAGAMDASFLSRQQAVDSPGNALRGLLVRLAVLPEQGEPVHHRRGREGVDGRDPRLHVLVQVSIHPATRSSAMSG